MVVSAGTPDVWREMDKGTRRYGDVLIRYYGLGMNTAQIGEELGIRREAVGNSLQLGMRRLWKLMSKHAKELPFDLGTEFPLRDLEATRVEGQRAAGRRTAAGRGTEWGRRTAMQRWYPTSDNAIK